jgi:transcription initiation factor TFIIIB Brf1 subunit/transcription initiation factor TFIIB
MKECYKYTTQKCEECQGTVVYCLRKEEYYCLECGLVQHENNTRE